VCSRFWRSRSALVISVPPSANSSTISSFGFASWVCEIAPSALPRAAGVRS
jgi:hypothetical protein